jgi:hypothetical protein
MAYYLVTANPKKELLSELKESLNKDSFRNLQPFGKALTFSLRNARIQENGKAVWEEEDYCSPPLKEEKENVLDKYFSNIEVKKVSKEEGWKEIENLPGLYDNLNFQLIFNCSS